MPDLDPTAAVRRRYDGIARFYDASEAPMDLLGGRRRRARMIRFGWRPAAPSKSASAGGGRNR